MFTSELLLYTVIVFAVLTILFFSLDSVHVGQRTGYFLFATVIWHWLKMSLSMLQLSTQQTGLAFKSDTLYYRTYTVEMVIFN